MSRPVGRTLIIGAIVAAVALPLTLVSYNTYVSNSAAGLLIAAGGQSVVGICFPHSTLPECQCGAFQPCWCVDDNDCFLWGGTCKLAEGETRGFCCTLPENAPPIVCMSIGCAPPTCRDPNPPPIPTGDHCGNGLCQISFGETVKTCAWDCYCGDGICDPDENQSSCPLDCTSLSSSSAASSSPSSEGESSGASSSSCPVNQAACTQQNADTQIPPDASCLWSDTNFAYNGDFELGNTGFRLETLTENAACEPLGSNQYRVTDDPQACDSSLDDVPGHDEVLIINDMPGIPPSGSYTPTYPLWSQVLYVQKHTDYIFSFEAKIARGSTPMKVFAGAKDLAGNAFYVTRDEWRTVHMPFHSQDSSYVTLQLTTSSYFNEGTPPTPPSTQWGPNDTWQPQLPVYVDNIRLRRTCTSCNDGVDNDRDGLTYYVQDLGCINSSDQTEMSECAATLGFDPPAPMTLVKDFIRPAACRKADLVTICPAPEQFFTHSLFQWFQNWLQDSGLPVSQWGLANFAYFSDLDEVMNGACCSTDDFVLPDYSAYEPLQSPAETICPSNSVPAATCQVCDTFSLSCNPSQAGSALPYCCGGQPMGDVNFDLPRQPDCPSSSSS